MSEHSDGGPSVDEFAEYCRTQSRLLAGRAETMREDVADRLDEIDAEVDAIQRALEDRADGTEARAAPQSTASPDAELADLEEREADLAEEQAVVEATQARLERFQALAAGYADLAERLPSEAADAGAALKAVVEFEAAEDAPAFFEERETLLEAAADSDEAA